MISLYLARPLLPLTVQLPPLLAKIEAELAGEKLDALEEQRLRQRAELIRSLLAPNPIT